MSPLPYRVRRGFGIVIAILLVGLIFYPGALASPYITAQDGPQYAHTIIPESSPMYEEYTSEYELETYRYDELSPVARELFDRTRAADPRPQYNDERRYIPDVCRDFVLVCDAYSQNELPGEFTYGTELSTEATLQFIEADERYLFQTGYTSHATLFAFPFRFFMAVLVMLPLAIGVAVTAVKSENARILAGTVGGGVVVAVLSLLAPYLEMYGIVSARLIGVLVLAGVWLVLLAIGGYKLSQSIFG